jgi:sugar lactone lactonase YvrE
LKIVGGMTLGVSVYLAKVAAPIEAIPYNWLPPPHLEPNTLLRKAQKLGPGTVEGPEALAFRGKYIFSGLADGRIIALDTEWSQADTLLFTGDPQKALPFPCAEYHTEPICGRPLGLQFDSRGMLYVIDAYMGLLEINVSNTRRMTPNRLSTNPNDKKRTPVRFGDGIAVSQQPKGPIYFTDASSLYSLRDCGLLMLDGRSTGRLLVYNPKTRQSSTLLEDLAFPNGVLLDPQEEFLLIAESAKVQILKYHLQGNRKGKVEVWASNLPIFPDNLSWDIDPRTGEFNGKVWVAGSKRSWISETLAGLPSVRNLIAKILKPETILALGSTEAVALRLDKDGTTLDAPQDSSGRITVLTGVYAHGDSLYLASFRKETKFIGKIARAELHLQGE